MASYEMGDMVVLVSGSMRMAVESVDGDMVSVVWCNEGRVGRDVFNAKLLNKWEIREDKGGHGGRPGGGRPWQDRGDRGGDRGGPRGGDRGDRGGDRGGRDDRGGGAKPWQNKGGDRGHDRGGDDRPPRKTGWDGKPREKKFYRKDD